MRFNSIAVVPVRSLEVGDLIAYEFLGDVISGKITGIANAVYQLTEEQRNYMENSGLDVPEEMYESLGGPTSCLIFGKFLGSRFPGQPEHMYIGYDVNVAVFPVKE